MKVYLELKNNRSRKFYEVQVIGSDIYINYGKIGSKGKNYIIKNSSLKAFEKLIKKKIKKGYLIKRKIEQLEILFME